MATPAPPDVLVQDILAETKARANIAVIADELDLEYRRIVPGLELRRFARDNGADLRDDEIKSFVASDIMAEAVDAEGNTTYLAVESVLHRRPAQRRAGAKPRGADAAPHEHTLPRRSHNARNGIVVSTDRSVSSRPMSAIALLNLASATFQAHRRPRPASAHPRSGLSVEQDVAICARLTAAASAAPPGQSASEAAAGQLSRLLTGLPEPRISRLLRLKPLDLHPQSHHQQPASSPLTRDIVANDTLVSVVSPFHRPRPVGEERRTMILPCTGS